MAAVVWLVAQSPACGPLKAAGDLPFTSVAAGAALHGAPTPSPLCVLRQQHESGVSVPVISPPARRPSLKPRR